MKQSQYAAKMLELEGRSPFYLIFFLNKRNSLLLNLRTHLSDLIIEFQTQDFFPSPFYFFWSVNTSIQNTIINEFF